MFIVDFDDTLFNTHRFKKARLAALEALGVPLDIFWQTYKKARNSEEGIFRYSDENHAKILGEYGFEEKEILEALKNVSKRMNEFLFDDAEDLLKALKKLGHKIVLLSLGEPEFQRMKVESTGVDKLVDEIKFVQDTKMHVVGDIMKTVGSTEDIWLINDKIVETRELKGAFPEIMAVIKLSHSLRDVNRGKIGMPCFLYLRDVQAYLEHYVK